MKKIKQPNRASCLPTSFAMVSDGNPKEIFNFLGHDGTEIVRPDSGIPLCYRGFDIQECLCACHYLYGVCFVEHSKEGFLGFSESDHIRIKIPWDWDKLLKGEGVLIGESHAVAWYQNQIHNPNGLIQNGLDFYFHTFFRKIIEK